MDFLPEERERGITITAAAITLPWRQHKVNLIDTPGHVDFTVEVERSLRVLEGAVVVLDAAKGVQAQTLTVWKQAMRYNVSPLVFINKMDKVGADPHKVLTDIRQKLGREPIPINWPKMNLGGNWTGELEQLLQAPKTIEKLAEFDLKILEAFLENQDISRADLVTAVKSNALIPVLFGSATKNIGIPQLLDAITDFLPPPSSKDSPTLLQALAFKVSFDHRRQQLLVFARVYSGKLCKGMHLWNVNKGITERATKLMRIMADELIEVEEIEEGSVGIILGLKGTSTGDTLAVPSEKTEALPGITTPAPVFSVGIEAISPGEQSSLDRGLELLQLEDPSIQITTNDAGQTILTGQGELHLEIAGSRLASVFGAKFSTGTVRVAVKEGLDPSLFKECITINHFIDKELFGVKLIGGVQLSLSVTDGMWLRFEKKFDYEYQSAMEEGARAALSTGPLLGCPVDLTTVTVTIKDAEIQSATSVNACRMATAEAVAMALKAAAALFKQSEPLARVVIESPHDLIGPITSDLFSLSHLHVQEFKNIFKNAVAGSSLIQDCDELTPYLRDWTGKFTVPCSAPSPFILLRPSNTEQVSAILKFCNEQRLGVIPVGGNTGLVGGSVPFPVTSAQHAPVLLSLERMRQIQAIEPQSGVIKAEAGCILESLDAALSEHQLRMPIDLGAKGSCQLGGILATNAGGIRFLRYGSLHGSALGMEVVLADGRVLSDMRALSKDNTGYDWKQLFIGSEGTLGVITAAAIRTPVKPAATNVACFLVKDFTAVTRLLAAAKQQLGEILSAFEFWDENCQSALEAHGKCATIFQNSPPPGAMYVLIETGGSSNDHDSQKLTSFCESVLSDFVLDGVLAQDQTQQANLWHLREGIPEASARFKSSGTDPFGLVHKFDISLPLAHYYRLVEIVRDKLDPCSFRVLGFGHVGDGNVHLNIVDLLRNEQSKATLTVISDFIYSWVIENGGSISAEHGIGQLKRDQFERSKSPSVLGLMRQFKHLLDPQGILNPGKIFKEM